MAEEPLPPPAGPSSPVPLAEAPLSEYVERRARGERPGVPAPPPPVAPSTPAGEAPPAELAAEAPPPVEPTPEQAAAAKASRTRGELQRRLDSLQAQLGYSQRQMERLQRERDEYAARVAAAQPAPAPAETSSEPESLDAYVQQVAAQVVEQRLSQEREAASRAYAQQRLHQAMATFPERADAAKAKHPDFDTAVANNDEVVLSPVMQHVCMESAHGAEFMYWLGTHPDAANRLGEMTRTYGPQQFDLVEEHLASQIAETAHRGVPAPAPSSAAPPPITPLGGGSTNASSVALDQLPLGEYVRRRNAELMRRRNGGR